MTDAAGRKGAAKNAHEGAAPAKAANLLIGEKAFIATIRRLNEGPPRLPRVDRAVALEALATYGTQRSLKGQEGRAKGTADPFSLAREREAREAGEQIAYWCDRYEGLTSPEEAAALSALMMAISQEKLERPGRGRKRTPFPNYQVMRLGQYYDSLRQSANPPSESDILKLLVRAVESGEVPLYGEIRPKRDKFPKAVEMFVKRALDAYINRKLP